MRKNKIHDEFFLSIENIIEKLRINDVENIDNVYSTQYHIVWIPKYRRHILNLGLKGYLRKLFPKVIKGLTGYKIVEYSMQVDNIHMIIPPRYGISEVI